MLGVDCDSSALDFPEPILCVWVSHRHVSDRFESMRDLSAVLPIAQPVAKGESLIGFGLIRENIQRHRIRASEGI